MAKMRRKRCKPKSKKRVMISRLEWLQHLVKISLQQAEREPEGSALNELFAHQAERIAAEIKQSELLDKLPTFSET